MLHQWPVVLSVLFAVFIQGSEANIDHFYFTPVDQIPKATVETNVPIHIVDYRSCARHCIRLGPTCQGFVMAYTQVFACTLLEGLTGVTVIAATNSTAYVNLYYEGQLYALAYYAMSWPQGVALCQSLGRSLVSYTTSTDKENWMKSLGGKWFFIGAKKDSLDPNRFYDINTGQTAAIPFEAGVGPVQSNVALIDKDDGTPAYRTGNDYFVWPLATILCTPK